MLNLVPQTIPALKPIPVAIWADLKPYQRVTISERREWIVTALTKVLEVLEAVPNSEFDLTIWHGKSHDSRKSCQTVGCAMGWSATIPWFRDRGFFLGDKGGIEFEMREGFKALYLFFKLENFYHTLMLEQLFSAMYYVVDTRDRVAKNRVQSRIKKFIAAIVRGTPLTEKQTLAMLNHNLVSKQYIGNFRKGFNEAFVCGGGEVYDY